MSVTQKNTLCVTLQPITPTSRFSLNIECTLPNQGVTAIFGPSGSGKTTLLRYIAGLESKQAGEIYFNGNCWQKAGFKLPSHKRAIGYVFQEGNLFPHLTAKGNLDFAAKRAQQNHKVISYNEIIDLMDIGSILSRYPEQLSGGEYQRIAIARALLTQPKLLLMDEPLAALDTKLKEDILPYLERICRMTNIPILYVSHSLEEVVRLADHLIIMEDGNIIEQGTTSSLISKRSPHINAHDISVILTGKVTRQCDKWKLTWLDVNGQHVAIPKQEKQVGSVCRIRIKACDIDIAKKEQSNSCLNQPKVIIERLEKNQQIPHLTTVRLRMGNLLLLANIPNASIHQLDIKEKMEVIAQIHAISVLS